MSRSYGSLNSVEMKYFVAMDFNPLIKKHIKMRSFTKPKNINRSDGSLNFVTAYF